MNMNEEMKLHQWAQDMAEQKTSGLSQVKWCNMKGIPINTFRYRCKKVCLAMEEKLQEQTPENTAIIPTEVPAQTPATHDPVFAKVNLTPEQRAASGINIKFRDTLVNIAPDAPECHVRMVLEVLANA